MKKKVLFIVFCSFLLTGVVSAASLWGNYKGNPIVRVKVDGTVHKTAVPAIKVNGQTYVPLNVLDKAGVKYSVDTKNQTMDFYKDSTFDAIRSIGNVTLTPIGVSSMEASVSFYQQGENEEADWAAIINEFKKLARLDVTYLKVHYYKNNVWTGSVSIGQGWVEGLNSGRNTETDLQNVWTVEGKLFRQPLSAKDIGKLKDRVGYVVAFGKDQKPIAQGSGFMISEYGLFVTNSHVASNGGGLRIDLNGKSYDTYGEYLFDDPDKDIFGVYIASKENKDADGKIIKPEKFSYLDYTTALPEIGDKVYAIGSPKGLENTLSQGIVSSIRTIDGIQLIQHSADIDHGSSGGVLLNEYGEAIGITSSGVAGSTFEFAVPMKYIDQARGSMN